MEVMQRRVAEILDGHLVPGLPPYRPTGPIHTTKELVIGIGLQGFDCGRADAGQEWPTFDSPCQYSRPPINFLRKLAFEAWQQGYDAGLRSGDVLGVDEVAFHNLLGLMHRDDS